MGTLGDRRPARPGLAQLVRDYRQRHRLTQQALADQSGVSLSMLKKVEGGERTPGARAVGHLGQVFGSEFTLRALYLLAKGESDGA